MNIKAKESEEVSLIREYYQGQLKQLLVLHGTIVKYPELPDCDIAAKHDQLSDLMLFIVQSNLDFTICCKNIRLHKELGSKYEMQYFARAIAVHCYDATQEPPKKLRLVNRIREIVKLYAEPSLRPVVEKISDACNKLSDILNVNREYIKWVRDNLFAHRDIDAIDQYRAMEDIDANRICEIGEEIDHTLYSIVRDLLTIQQLINPMIEDKSTD